jgi:ankyrin repeat protein
MRAKRKIKKHSGAGEGEGRPPSRWGMPRSDPAEPGMRTQLRGMDQCSLLRDAASAGNEGLAQKLLEFGADVDARDSDGNTPLILASRNGRADMCRLLLSRGADPCAQNRRGDTPMYWTTESGRMELCDGEISRILKAFGAY